MKPKSWLSHLLWAEAHIGRAAFCWGLWTGPGCVPEPFPRARFPWNSSTLGPRFLMNHSTRGGVGISEREHTCGAWIHMEINRKTKLRFLAPGGRKLPLPDLGTTGYILKHFPRLRLPAPPECCSHLMVKKEQVSGPRWRGGWQGPTGRPLRVSGRTCGHFPLLLSPPVLSGWAWPFS